MVRILVGQVPKGFWKCELDGRVGIYAIPYYWVGGMYEWIGRYGIYIRWIG